MLADRVVVLDSNPGRIKAELPVVLGRSRHRKAPEFVDLVEHIHALMTGRVEQPSTPTADLRRTPASVPLPHASVDALSGLAEIMVPLGPLSADELADELYLEVDLLPLIDALELLELAQVEAGQMELTTEGQTFAGADIQASKEMFAAAALARAPLVRALFNGLERAGDHTLRIGFFRDVLRRAFSEAETDRQLDVALDWALRRTTSSSRRRLP